jgi:hypothetical protein
MAAVDPAANRVGHETLGQQCQAESKRRLHAGQAQFLLHRTHEQGKGIEQAAPTDELRQ